MEAKQLMIGDWTKFRESKYPHKRGDIYKIDNYDSLSLAHRLCGVPLTEEILKANGFRLIGFHKLVFIRDDGGFASYNRVTHCVSVDCDGSVKKNIGYVHELQHALRLCGFDELADNFKIND